MAYKGKMVFSYKLQWLRPTQPKAFWTWRSRRLMNRVSEEPGSYQVSFHFDNNNNNPVWDFKTVIIQRCKWSNKSIILFQCYQNRTGPIDSTSELVVRRLFKCSSLNSLINLILYKLILLNRQNHPSTLKIKGMQVNLPL